MNSIYSYILNRKASPPDIIIIHRLSRWFFIYRLKGSATSRV